MKWMNALLDKLNINALLLALCITCIISWYYTKIFIFIGVALLLGIYLGIILITWYWKYLKNKKIYISNQKIKEDKEIEKAEQENLLIDIWYKSINKVRKDQLIALMNFESLDPSSENIKIEDVKKGNFFPYDEYYYSITNDYRNTICPVCQIDIQGDNRVFFIHPHLYALLKNE